MDAALFATRAPAEAATLAPVKAVEARGMVRENACGHATRRHKRVVRAAKCVCPREQEGWENATLKAAVCWTTPPQTPAGAVSRATNARTPWTHPTESAFACR